MENQGMKLLTSGRKHMLRQRDRLNSPLVKHGEVIDLNEYEMNPNVEKGTLNTERRTGFTYMDDVQVGCDHPKAMKYRNGDSVACAECEMEIERAVRRASILVFKCEGVSGQDSEENGPYDHRPGNSGKYPKFLPGQVPVDHKEKADSEA